jgi:hypothetical protein
VRDNIGMITDTALAGGQWVVPGWSGSKLWIYQDPNAGADWTTGGNAVMTYAADETGFSDRALKRYSRAAGTLAATAGTVSTYRFAWPHGSIARSDAHQGLG